MRAAVGIERTEQPLRRDHLGKRDGGKRARLAGLGYGAAWWVLGPLTFMPWIMGMDLAANWTAADVRASLPSLMGHLVFGLVLGIVYHRLQSAGSKGTLAAPASAA